MRDKVEKPRNTVFFQCFVANCTPLWREGHFQAKMVKLKHIIVGPRVEVEMMKSVLRFGAKRISKSKCSKHFRFGALVDVEMWKK